MATSQNPNSICKIVQGDLAKSFPFYKGADKPLVGTLDALRSRENIGSGTQVQGLVQGAEMPTGDTSTGRIVTLRGFKNNCAPCVDGTFDPCNWDSTNPQNKIKDYSYVVDQSSCPAERLLTLADIRKMCDGSDTYTSEMVREMANEVKRNINAKAILIVKELMGNYTDGTDSKTTPKTLNLLGAGASTLNFSEFTKLNVEYRKMGYSQKPIIVGGNQTAFVDAMRGALGMNSNGLDLSKTGIPTMYQDFDIDGVYNDGNSHLLSWIPSTFQLLEWYNTERIGGTFKKGAMLVDGVPMYEEEHGTIIVDDMKFDLYMKYDPCGGYKMRLHKYFGIAELPLDVVCADKYPALHYEVGCGVATC
jgi:hypothetical protein